MTQVTEYNYQVKPILPNDYDSAWRLSVAISKSGLAPNGIQTPEAIFTAIQLGAEVGLTPMQSLQNIAVVNGKPTIWGDAQLALVRGSRQLEKFEESLDEATMTATCVVRRKGDEVDTVSKFSKADALTAGLWEKSGPWKQYPKRMLKMRARAFALRDAFPDVLKGIYATEELQGMPTVEGEVITVASASDLNKEFVADAVVEKKAEEAPDLSTQKGAKEAATILILALEALPAEDRAGHFLQASGDKVIDALSQHGLGMMKSKFTALGINLQPDTPQA